MPTLKERGLYKVMTNMEWELWRPHKGMSIISLLKFLGSNDHGHLDSTYSLGLD